TGASPVISRIMAHNRRASSRRCSSGTVARNPSTDASVRRIAGSFLVAMPSCSHSCLDLRHGALDSRSACHYQESAARYLTVTHGQLAGQVSIATTGGYVALQAGGQRLQPSGLRRRGRLRRFTQHHMVPFVRKNLTVADLGDLLGRPLVAVLATARTDGT